MDIPFAPVMQTVAINVAPDRLRSAKDTVSRVTGTASTAVADAAAAWTDIKLNATTNTQARTDRSRRRGEASAFARLLRERS